MYKRILVATDGSHASRLATLQAIELARACRGQIRLVYVVDDSAALFSVAHVHHDDLLRTINSYGRHALNACARLIEAVGVPVSTKLLCPPLSKGGIAGTILAHAESWDADLIALGTHGRHGLSRLAMGSVAQDIVRHSPTPVLLIHDRKQD